MTSRSRYLSGLAGIGALTLAVSRGIGQDARPFLVALALAVVVQAPLGWWLIRSIGSERFVLAWSAGLGARLVLVGGMGLVGAPLLGFRPAAVLVPLVGVLVALLALEVVVVALAQPGAEVQ